MEPSPKYYSKEFLESLDILFEKTFDLDDDVNYIWDNYFSKVVEDYKKNPHLYYTKKNVVYKISSADLPSEFSKKAHSTNPIEIIIGQVGNRFDPINRNIFLNINKEFIEWLGDQGINGSRYKVMIKEFPGLALELDEHSLKSSIYHELSHWIDDSLNSSHIKKLVASDAKKYQDKRGDIDYDLFNYYSPHEINAIIHAIKSLKIKYNDIDWNNLTFIELLKQKSQFYELLFNVMKKGHNMYGKWIKKFFGRLIREGLRGGKMIPLTFEDMKKEYQHGTFGNGYKKL